MNESFLTDSSPQPLGNILKFSRNETKILGEIIAIEKSQKIEALKKILLIPVNIKVYSKSLLLYS